MAVTCFCGSTFAGVETLEAHAQQCGHSYQCSGCHGFYKSLTSTIHHQAAKAHCAGTHIKTLSELIKTTAATSTSATSAPSKQRKCSFCPDKKPFKDAGALKAHQFAKHPSCPTCLQTFTKKAGLSDVDRQLRDHQEAAGHCFCPEHDLAFRTNEAYEVHTRKESHASFGCADCERTFGSEKALEHHLEECPALVRKSAEVKAAAALQEAEESSLRCEPCDRKLKCLAGLRAHKSSVKHNPLSEIKCFLGDCKQVFTSPSAWLFHLESGKCKSGINRLKLNGLVHAHDTDSHITFAENGPARNTISTSIYSHFIGTPSTSDAGVLLTPRGGSAASVLSTDTLRTKSGLGRLQGVVLTPTASSSASVVSDADTEDTVLGRGNSGIILTSTSTVSRASAALAEWTPILDAIVTPATSFATSSTDETVTFDSIKKNWPCPKCVKTFMSRRRVEQHMSSPYHMPKLFHCPPAAAVGLHATSKPEKSFKTLSGLAQHLETGACNGGMELLRNLARMFEQRVEAVTGNKVKLLRAA